MKTRFTALFALFALMLNASAFAAAAGSGVAKETSFVTPVPASPLVQMLPTSDVVASVDVRRVFDDMLPRVLSSKQPVLAKVMSSIDEIQSKTGIDVRKFGQLAVGLKFKNLSVSNPDFDFVAITRGEINAGALVGLVKVGTNGKYREVKVGDKTMYVFKVEDTPVAKKTSTSGKQAAGRSTANAGKRPAAKPASAAKAPPSLQEIAVSILDANTLAIGSTAQVRETLAATTSVSADLVSLLSTESAAIVTFAGQMPAGTAKLLPLENDEIGKAISSIRYVAGSVDMNDSGALLRILARTLQAEQAQSLLDMVQGLQMVGKAFLSSSKRPDQQVFARMLENARFTRQGNDVSLELSVAQSDIDVLVAGIK